MSIPENSSTRLENSSAEGRNHDPRIKWDDSHARSSVPEVWNVAGTREEIALLFGAMGRNTDEEPVCELRNRILMSPFVAKRLSIALEACIRRYESDYGTLELGSGPDGLIGVSPPALKGPAAFRTDYAEDLVRIVRELGVRIGFERSFKLCRETLLGNRFLLGINKKEIEGRRNERILDVCARMNMPAEFIEEFSRGLAEANYIHFGFEEDESTCVYKAYLEFHEKIEQQMKKGPKTSFGRPLLHLGFKWEPSDPSRRVVTTYTWEPFIPYERAADNLSAILDPYRSGAVLEFAKEILGMASRRVPHQDLLYLEVAEKGNPRKSFDLNVYRAGLRLGELYPLLLRMCRHYAVLLERFHRLYEPAKEQVFGHVAGGIDRRGRDFLTVYYGVESLRDEALLADPLRKRKSSHGGTTGEESFSGIEKTDEKAALLFRLVKELDVKVGFERSFKMLKGALLTDRFLLGFRSRGAGEGLDARIMNICRRIEMPLDHLAMFEKHLSESSIVLFGFEKNGETRLCKAYLEFGDKVTAAPEPFLMHIGFKWNPSDPSHRVLARYTCFPRFTDQDILGRLGDVFYGHKHKELLGLAEEILETASVRRGAGEFLYFEVEEEDNPRASFDINMYIANLRVREMYPFLLKMMSHFSIPQESFYPLYGTMSGQIFGHLTGGVDREGRDFLTVYYGEKGSTRATVQPRRH